ncbi:MAG: hypothetical protein U9O94_08460 [Nanoarchaeota archaeon]|nr:hypothetical protein [Nanoarchaeota archaeon]
MDEPKKHLHSQTTNHNRFLGSSKNLTRLHRQGYAHSWHNVHLAYGFLVILLVLMMVGCTPKPTAVVVESVGCTIEHEEIDLEPIPKSIGLDAIEEEEEIQYGSDIKIIMRTSQVSEELVRTEINKIPTDIISCPNIIEVYNLEGVNWRAHFITDSKTIELNIAQAPDMYPAILHEARHCVWRYNLTSEDQEDFCKQNIEAISSFGDRLGDYYPAEDWCEEVYASEI